MTRVLIVDDSETKIDAITSCLSELGIQGADIFSACDAASARRALEERYYDLMLLDVLLPGREGAQASGDVSADFLREIVEDETSTTPGRIVAISADPSALETYAPGFRRLVTQVLHVEVGRDEWRYSLKCLVANIKATMAARNQYDYDVCIQTALRTPELSEVLGLSDIEWGPEELLSNGLLFNRGELRVGSKVLKLACAHAAQMGLVPACHLTTVLLENLRPRLLLMAGFCGSIDKDTQIGDLIVANKSWDWQAGKWDEKGVLQIAPDQKDASAQLVSIARGFEREIDDICRQFDRGERPSDTPVLRVAPIASGSSVVADPGFHQMFKQQHRKLDGIDMECYGFYYAASFYETPRPQILCMKAVSDKADAGKGDRYQRFCSFLSAQAVLYVIKRHFGV